MGKPQFTPEDLAAWRKSILEATAGPWISDLDTFDGETIEACVSSPSDKKPYMLARLDAETMDWKAAKASQAAKDAAFIALARTALPWLLDDWEAMVKRLGADFERQRNEAWARIAKLERVAEAARELSVASDVGDPVFTRWKEMEATLRAAGYGEEGDG